MGFIQELSVRVEEVASAGGKFADALVRTAGLTLSRALVFVDRELGYAQRFGKKSSGTKPGGGKQPGRNRTE
jgi:hypothetical protein